MRKPFALFLAVALFTGVASTGVATAGAPLTSSAAVSAPRTGPSVTTAAPTRIPMETFHAADRSFSIRMPSDSESTPVEFTYQRTYSREKIGTIELRVIDEPQIGDAVKEAGGAAVAAALVQVLTEPLAEQGYGIAIEQSDEDGHPGAIGAIDEPDTKFTLRVVVAGERVFVQTALYSKEYEEFSSAADEFLGSLEIKGKR